MPAVRVHGFVRTAIRFAITISAVAVALLLRLQLTARVGEGLPTYITFYPAVMVAALMGGLAFGLVATALSALAVAYWVLPPSGFGVSSGVDVVGLVLFSILGILISVVAELYARSRRRAAAFEKDLALQEVHRDKEESLRHLNTQLAERNEELTRQAEELSQQTEELSQQSEELSRQNEELQAQTEEIQALNLELGRRETLLQTLLESARLAVSEEAALHDVCAAALDMFGEPAAAVAVYERRAGFLAIRTTAGIRAPLPGSEGTVRRFVDLVIEQNRTASLKDVSLRPDLSILAVPGEPPFQAALAAPLHAAGQPFGAVAIYSRHKQEWSAEQFRLADWLAAQCAHILDILRLQNDLRRQAALIDLSPDAIIVRRLDGAIALWGRGAEVLYGWTKAEALGQTTHTLLQTRFPEPLEQITRQVQETGRWSGELTHTCKDGREVTVESRWLAERDAGGGIVDLLESNVDITDRKRAEADLQQSEARYGLLFENLLDGFAYCRMIFDDLQRPRDFVYVRVNSAFGKLTGLENVAGRRVTEVIPGIEKSNPELFEIYGRVVTTGQPEKFEMYLDPLKSWLSVSVYRPEPGHFVAVFDNVTERKLASEALRRSEEQLRVATTAAEIGVWSWVPGTSQVVVSANWRRLFGVAADAAVTFETWAGALHPDDRDRAIRELNDAGEQHREFDTEYRVVRPDGSLVWIVDRGRAWYDQAGPAIGMAGVNVDITERKRAEETLREADRRKGEFLATLSHELRNPLAPIRYALELLRCEGDDGSPAHPKRVIERQLGHLVHLVDDLLDVTRIASNKIRLRKTRVDLAAVVQHAVEATAPDIEQANHSLLVSLPPEPLWVEADPDRLAQVLTNLLNNAARYTPQGGRLSITAATVHDEVAISVSDTGIGLRPEDQERVFEMFTQVGEPGHGGLGIGLALVRGLVELHGGSIEARSKGPGLGSEFRIRLPRAQAPAAPDAAAGARVRAEGGATQRILVVDDNLDSADMLKTFLEIHGHDVRVANDGPSALAMLAEFAPDIGLFDIGLPGMSGYDLARRVRADARNDAMYLVAVTGWGQEEDRLRARDCGFNAHLTKPADPEELRRLIARAAGGDDGMGN
jgi:PAS domain S-box-containing protein